MHTATGLLQVDFCIPSLDYKTLIETALFLTRDIQEAEKMFRLMAFNVVGQDKDDYAKSFSFVYKNNRWQVSPAYDLVPSEGFNGQQPPRCWARGCLPNQICWN